jgi:hypothetical protein
MDLFVRRLVERMHDPGAPLSRNRHFHVFDSPEGRVALRLSRRLKALQADLLAAQHEGTAPTATFSKAEGVVKVEIRFTHLRSLRLTTLSEAEFELLCLLPGVKGALGR